MIDTVMDNACKNFRDEIEIENRVIAGKVLGG